MRRNKPAHHRRHTGDSSSADNNASTGNNDTTALANSQGGGEPVSFLKSMAMFFNRHYVLSVEDINVTIESVAIISALNIAIILALVFVPSQEDFERADEHLRPGVAATVDSFWEAISEELPSARGMLIAGCALSFSIFSFAGSLMLILSSRESGFRPIRTEDKDEYARILHVNLWYKFFRWVVFLLILTCALSLFLLFWACNIYVNFRFPLYGQPKADDLASAYSQGAFDMSFGAWALLAIALYIVVCHFYIFFKAVNKDLLLQQQEAETLESALYPSDRGLWHNIFNSLFKRPYLVSADDVSATLETVAVVSALSIAAILSILFVADVSEIMDADTHLRPNATYSDFDTLPKARDAELPSARGLTIAYVSLGFAIMAFGGSLLLILSSRENGFCPTTDDTGVLHRLRHVNLWYKLFRWLVFLLVVCAGLSLFMLFWTTNIYINYRFPKYGNPKDDDLASAYAEGAFDLTFGGWMVCALGVYTLVVHFYIYNNAIKRGYMLLSSEIDS